MWRQRDNNNTVVATVLICLQAEMALVIIQYEESFVGLRTARMRYEVIQLLHKDIKFLFAHPDGETHPIDPTGGFIR